mmetsp:Transcript_26504/g.43770  ORF Transcript_26504/g.43770 Transcript_26504/m.43770 type:complete len:292 (-) Transcript_26504:222-1097(-)
MTQPTSNGDICITHSPRAELEVDVGLDEPPLVDEDAEFDGVLDTTLNNGSCLTLGDVFVGFVPAVEALCFERELCPREALLFELGFDDFRSFSTMVTPVLFSKSGSSSSNRTGSFASFIRLSAFFAVLRAAPSPGTPRSLSKKFSKPCSSSLDNKIASSLSKSVLVSMGGAVSAAFGLLATGTAVSLSSKSTSFLSFFFKAFVLPFVLPTSCSKLISSSDESSSDSLLLFFVAGVFLSALFFCEGKLATFPAVVLEFGCSGSEAESFFFSFFFFFFFLCDNWIIVAVGRLI